MSLGDASLEVQQGRPDVEGLLRKAAAEAGPGNVVGVYAGGEPQGCERLLDPSWAVHAIPAGAHGIRLVPHALQH